jgi:hypothetical protein
MVHALVERTGDGAAVVSPAVERDPGSRSRVCAQVVVGLDRGGLCVVRRLVLAAALDRHGDRVAGAF